MTEAEAKRILTEYGAPANIAKHIEAINTAIRALGMMEEKWRKERTPSLSKAKR